MYDLQLFSFKGQELRVFEINGELWFVAIDIAKFLGYKNTADAIRSHCKHTRSARDLFEGAELAHLGLHPQTILIPESDVYRLIAKCTLPVADELDTLLYEEILPTLRKTGKYELASPSKRLSQQATEMEATASIFKSFHTIGTLAGFKGNQLTLSANLATRKLTWIDSLELMELTHLPVEVQETLLIPKQIGERLGGLSSIKVNKMLEELGLQIQTSYVGKGNVIKKFWELTKEGKQYGIYVDTSRKYNDGTPIRNIKWYESVIELLKGKAKQ